MAMQTGIGFSKILVIAGAGYTSTILLKNGKLSDLLTELQVLVKGYEQSGEQSDGESDAILSQIRRLAMEVRQISSSRQITVVNGGSGGSNYSSLILPAAAAGALGYGYMWWKGISLFDLMYVTKRSMETAVTNLTKHLEHVTEALASAKKHLTQRIQNVDDKMVKQHEQSKAIQEDVSLALDGLSNIEGNLDALRNMISGLDGKIDTMEYKQDIANIGVQYLCNFIDGRNTNIPEILAQERLQISANSRARNYLTNVETPSLNGLKDIVDTLSGDVSQPHADTEIQVGIQKPMHILRTVSARR